MHHRGEATGTVLPFLRDVALAYRGEGALPYEVEVVMTAKEFGVTPSEIEDEEDALLHIGLEGQAVLRALAARDAFLGSKGRVRWTPAQGRIIMRVDEILKEEGVEKEREFKEDFVESDLAGINIED